MSGATIAIDGYSSCGKSTLAKEIAKKLNYSYIDSGAMYRAVTLFMLRNNIITDGHFKRENVIEALADLDIRFQHNPELGVSETFLNGDNVELQIRTSEVSANVSAISAIPEVRDKLVRLQKKLGREGSVVMDGRDIGTVVFPQAEVKIFMTASNEVRAQRRLIELQDKGENVGLEDVKIALAKRDDYDMNREISPLMKAEDAVEIDNSNLNREEQLELAMSIIQERLNNTANRVQ